VFDAYGRSNHFVTAANLTAMLADNPDLIEIGAVGGQYDSTAGNATLTLTVPTGKYWRLIGFGYHLTTDANVANRQVVVAPSTSAPVAFSTITFPVRAASGTQNGFCLFESEYPNIVGDITGATGGKTVRGVGTCSTCSVSMVTNPTTGDTVTIAGIKYTFLDTFVDAEHNIHIGAAAANSQTNLLNAIEGVAGGTPGTDYYTSEVAHPYVEVPLAAWSGNVLTCQARYPGTWIEDTITYPVAETFTDPTDHVHAFSGGVDAGFPVDGGYLGPGEKLVATVTNGVAGDTLQTWVTYLQYDNDPRPA
jgi:hypothetical protein